MLTVRTQVKTSSIHGQGVFADEPIRRGDKIWQYTDDDFIYTQESVMSMDEALRESVLFYGNMLSDATYLLCGDNARYMNHCDDANTLCTAEGCFAVCDIQVGEEITCDYGQFEIRPLPFIGRKEAS